MDTRAFVRRLKKHRSGGRACSTPWAGRARLNQLQCRRGCGRSCASSTPRMATTSHGHQPDHLSVSFTSLSPLFFSRSVLVRSRLHLSLPLRPYEGLSKVHNSPLGELLIIKRQWDESEQPWTWFFFFPSPQFSFLLRHSTSFPQISIVLLIFSAVWTTSVFVSGNLLDPRLSFVAVNFAQYSEYFCLHYLHLFLELVYLICTYLSITTISIPIYFTLYHWNY